MCVSVCVFTVESGSLQINSHPYNMVLLPTGLLSRSGNGTWKQLTSACKKNTPSRTVHQSK